MTLIETGVMMRHAMHDASIYPGRTLRDVHRARHEESIRYRVEQVGGKTVTDGWEHLTYRFHYRYMARTFSTTVRYGMLAGEPQPYSGLATAFDDVHATDFLSVEDFANEFGMERTEAAKLYYRIDSVRDRLLAFFGSETEMKLWERILDEENTQARFIRYTTFTN